MRRAAVGEVTVPAGRTAARSRCRRCAPPHCRAPPRHAAPPPTAAYDASPKKTANIASDLSPPPCVCCCPRLSGVAVFCCCSVLPPRRGAARLPVGRQGGPEGEQADVDAHADPVRLLLSEVLQAPRRSAAHCGEPWRVLDGRPHRELAVPDLHEARRVRIPSDTRPCCPALRALSHFSAPFTIAGTARCCASRR